MNDINDDAKELCDKGLCLSRAQARRIISKTGSKEKAEEKIKRSRDRKNRMNG